MNIFDRIQSLDRRWIYLMVALAITVPLLIVFDSMTYTTEQSENIYQLIDSYSGREDRAILINFMHDASTMPELFPMEVAILRHAFLRDVKVFTICFTPTAAPLVDFAINTVKEEFPHIVSGEHYINIGYKPAALYLPIVLGLGDDIAEAVETDSEGRRVENLPMMDGLKNYNELNLVIETSGSSFGAIWYTYARPRFGVNVAAGITAVMAADAYPQLQTGQLIGILAGLKGAAEYEKMVDLFAAQDRPFSRDKARTQHMSITDETIPYKFKTARVGMNAQSIAHVLIIVFIILGNIGYFVEKQKEKKIL
jgi:hypothetical protein